MYAHHLHHINRRSFVSSAALGFASLPLAALAQNGLQSSVRDRILILVELKGGNDSLNTVIPYANPLYGQLRPSIGIKTEDIIRIDSQQGLHPSLAAKPRLTSSCKVPREMPPEKRYQSTSVPHRPSQRVI
jgi:uncharacterized protein (DUF1501 family)